MAQDKSDVYTRIGRAEIAATGIGVSPRGIASYESLQNAAFDNGPAASQAAQDAADQAAIDAAASQAAADAAAATGAQAQGSADAARIRADAAYDLAGAKVNKNAGPAWGAPSGSVSRAAFTAYAAPAVSAPPTQAEVQALAAAVQELSQRMVAMIADLRANGALSS